MNDQRGQPWTPGSNPARQFITAPATPAPLPKAHGSFYFVPFAGRLPRQASYPATKLYERSRQRVQVGISLRLSVVRGQTHTAGACWLARPAPARAYRSPCGRVRRRSAVALCPVCPCRAALRPRTLSRGPYSKTTQIVHPRPQMRRCESVTAQALSQPDFA